MVRVDQFAVDDDLVPGRDEQQVVEDHLLRGNGDDGVVAADVGDRGGEQGEPVEGAFGPQLLGGTDQGVEQQHHPEQRVLGRGDDEGQHEQPAQQCVERGEHVGPHDLAHGPAGRDLGSVDPPVGNPFGHLGSGEPAQGTGGGEQRHRIDPCAKGPSA